MKHPRLALALLAAAAALPLSAQQNRRSPHETAGAVLGDRPNGIRVTVVYGRPYTKDPKTGEPRKIWGALVPWGQPYRLGADEATLLVTQKPVVIGGTEIPAGAHVLYMIPMETGASKLAVSGANVGGWGVPVDESADLVRVDLKKEALDKPVDQLTLAVEKDPAGFGTLSIAWENARYTAAIRAPGLAFPAASPSATYRQRVGVTDVEVVYSRPSMRGRAIYGGLVPYGEVWRTGANDATTISFSTPVTVQGTRVEAGKYELFTIPGADEWTVILQKASHQWGAYAYDQRNDVARVTVKPNALETPYETFTIGINNVRDDSATLFLLWERTRVPVQIGTDIVASLVPKVEAAMAGPEPRPYAQAAMFYLEHNLDLAKANGWMDAFLEKRPDFFPIIYRKALIQAKMGDKEGAIATATKSRDLAAKATGPEKEEYIRLNEALIASLK